MGLLITTRGTDETKNGQSRRTARFKQPCVGASVKDLRDLGMQV